MSCYLNKQIRGNKQRDIHMHSLAFKKVHKYQNNSRELHARIILLIYQTNKINQFVITNLMHICFIS
jgi:hypothetical protein